MEELGRFGKPGYENIYEESFKKRPKQLAAKPDCRNLSEYV
jgi:hypothetical protein